MSGGTPPALPPSQPQPAEHQATAKPSTNHKTGGAIAISLAMLALALFRLWSSSGGGLHLGHTAASAPFVETVKVPPRPTAAHAIEINWRVRQVVASGPKVLASTAKGLALLSDDGGQQWRISTVATSAADLSNAAILPDGRLLLLDAPNKQLFQSSDHGAHWQAQSLSLGKDRAQLDELRLTPQGQLLGWADNHYQRSDDQGVHWRPVGQGLSEHIDSTASQASAERAGRGSAAKALERQTQLLMQSMYPNNSPIAMSMATFSSRPPDEDLSISGDLKHWLHTKSGVIAISHDEGASFQTAQLQPAWPIRKNEDDGSTYLESPYVLASAIADDGQMAVVVFGHPTDTMSTGTVLDSIDRRGSYQIYVSRDGGKHFKRMEGSLDEYDIGGVQIADPAKSSFYVFHSGLSGISFHSDDSPGFTQYPSGGFAYNNGAMVGQRWLFAGTQLAALNKDGLEQLTTDSTAATCAPQQLQESADHHVLFGIGRDRCVAVSNDGGQHWTAHPETAALLGATKGSNNDESDDDEDVSFRLAIDGNDRLLVGYSDPAEQSADASSSAASPSVSHWIASTDRGAHWQRHDMPGPTSPDVSSPGTKPSMVPLSDEIGSAWLLDCSDKRHKARQSCIALGDSENRIYRSDDGGRHWTMLNLPYAPAALYDGRVSVDGKQLVISTSAGVLISADGGNSFQRWSGELEQGG